MALEVKMKQNTMNAKSLLNRNYKKTANFSAQRRVHLTSAGIRPHFRGSSSNRRIRRLAAFLAKSHPCLAGNACRWAATP